MVHRLQRKLLSWPDWWMSNCSLPLRQIAHALQKNGDSLELWSGMEHGTVGFFCLLRKLYFDVDSGWSKLDDRLLIGITVDNTIETFESESEALCGFVDA